jgi:hypothetical protein
MLKVREATVLYEEVHFSISTCPLRSCAYSYVLYHISGRTPLLLAARVCDLVSTALLLGSGADPTSCTQQVSERLECI